MRLLIISNYYYPEVGAAPYRIYVMAKGLANTNKVEVISPLPNYPNGKILKPYKNKLYKIEQVEQVKAYRYFIYPSNSKHAILRIISMCSFAISLWLSVFHIKKKNTIDAVIVQNSPLLISFSSILLFKKLLRKKIVLNVSDIWPDSALDLGYIKKGRFYNLLKKIELFNYRNSKIISGQSQEILDYITNIYPNKNTFLYRNIQPNSEVTNTKKTDKITIVYAGIIGVAQGILELLNHTNFDALNIQLDLYGNGPEKDDIVNLIAQKNIKNVAYKGIVSKTELNTILPKYHYGLVPLTTHIKGAVPSKIFDFVSHNIPVIYLGFGEAKQLVESHNLGFAINSKDYNALNQVLQQIKNLSITEYNTLVNACKTAKKEVFNFEKQLHDFNAVLKAKL